MVSLELELLCSTFSWITDAKVSVFMFFRHKSLLFGPACPIYLFAKLDWIFFSSRDFLDDQRLSLQQWGYALIFQQSDTVGMQQKLKHSKQVLSRPLTLPDEEDLLEIGEQAKIQWRDYCSLLRKKERNLGIFSAYEKCGLNDWADPGLVLVIKLQLHL